VREIRTLRSMWRGLETWPDRNTSIGAGAPVLDPTEDAALECWQTIGPGGQARYMGAAIQTSLMLRAAFKLTLRQIEGLMTSVLSLMGLTISAPDHTTVSRRAVTLPVIQATSIPVGPLHVLIDSTGLQVYGAGQWMEAKHGAKSRRTWRKLHLAVDAANSRRRTSCQAEVGRHPRRTHGCGPSSSLACCLGGRQRRAQNRAERHRPSWP
jgi:hypothetical protein